MLKVNRLCHSRDVIIFSKNRNNACNGFLFCPPNTCCIFVMDNIKLASLDMNFHNCSVVFPISVTPSW